MAYRRVMERPEVEVRRSTRRRRTVSAYREGAKIVVLVPASLSRREEAEWVEAMVARIEKAEAKARPSDDDLARRAGIAPDEVRGLLAMLELDGRVRRGSDGWRRVTSSS